MCEYLLELRGVCKAYPFFKLKDISFGIEKGKIVGFIGRNGAGKTTTLKAIMNLIPIDKGQCLVFGHDMASYELEAKSRIGFSLSEINYYPDTKVSVISDVTRRFYKNFDADKYAFFKDKFKIDENKKIKELSSGMKVKYNLLLSLSHGAQLLILDEPTSGLDPVSRDEVVEIFQQFVSDGQRSILFSSHITSDLEKCADDIVYIRDGEIRYFGSMDALLDSYRIVECDESFFTQFLTGKFISYRRHSHKVSALLKSQDTEALGLKFRPPSLEEIMLFFESREVGL